MVFTRFVGSGRASERGLSGTHKQDFLAHVEGGDWFHDATMIQMNPILSGYSATTVEGTLQEMNQLIISAGTGFIAIGNTAPDGYVDGYAKGNYNVGSVETPTLVDAFNAAFLDSRLKDGGIILVMAGTYQLTSTVSIPPGICIMGEITGTIIIGEVTEQPMFLVNNPTRSIVLGGNSGSGAIKITPGSNFDQTRLYNLTLVDNLNGMVNSGNATMTTVPMVRCKISSNFVCDRVSFIGRLNDGPVLNRIKTLQAIGYVAGGGTGTTLTLNDCYFDGFSIGISFLPGNGIQDNLIINKCRARIYGTENNGDQTAASNCFLNATLCNANITNNFHLGVGFFTYSMINFTTSAAADVKVVISGNTGNPVNTTSGNALFVANNSGVALPAVITGNNWGNTLNSWYIVVGSGAYPVGDIIGTSALDTVITLANSNNFQGTVIVNPGSYTVTKGETRTNLRLVGNKRGKTYPIITLNSSAVSTDTQVNKFWSLGNYIQSIQFNCTGSAHSLKPSFDNTEGSHTSSPANNIEVVDCIFNNVCLYPESPGAGPWVDGSGNLAQLAISVRDCHFYQSGTFVNKVSCALPPVNIVNLKSCYFTGTGYNLSIGDPGYGGMGVVNATQITVDSCTFDGSGGAISAFSPFGSSVSSLITIANNPANVCITNCQILSDPGFDPTSSPYTLALRNNASFHGFYNSYIRITAADVVIDNCVICGPGDAGYTSGGATTYAQPTLGIEPLRSARVNNCKFVATLFPIKFGGSNIFSQASLGDGISVSNCGFSMNGVDPAGCAIDVDSDLNTGDVPFIRIVGNSFNLNPTSLLPIQHFNAVGAFYNATGVVQIYAPQSAITVENNKINNAGWGITGFDHISGLVVNNFNNSGSSGNLLVSTIISNNTILNDNNFTSATSTQSASCAYIKSSCAKVTDNHFSMSNEAALSNSFIGCLVMDVELTTSGTGDGLVAHNLFMRTTQGGFLHNIKRGYVQITNGGVRGKVVDNSFDSPTINGTLTTLVEDNNIQPNKWTVTRNKNQTETITLRGMVGRVINSISGGNLAILGVFSTNLIVFLGSITSDATTLQLSYVSGTQAFAWAASLFEFLPQNVRIISASITGSASALFTTGTFTFQLAGNGLTTVSNTLDFSSSTPITSTLTPSNSSATTTFVNNADLNLQIELFCTNISAGGARTLDLSVITFVYRW